MKLYDNVEILFSDNHILIALKPAGLLTQPSPTVDESLELYVKNWVKEKYEKKGNVFLHSIHRLDKCVSGLVIFARTSKALSRLNEQVRNFEIQRKYTAEIEGHLKETEGRLDHYLIHGDQKALVSKKGAKDAKHARLTFQVLMKREKTTLVEVELETGRYHQIRAQFSAIGHPILGDKKYGSREGNGNVISLHCTKVLFKHPVTKELIELKSAPSFG